MPKKILIVDDSEMQLAYTAKVLAKAGYEVQTAENIWFSSQVSSFEPDLILIDVHLGAAVGTTAVRALNHRSFAKQVWIVLYSTLERTQLDKLAEECGAHGAITKSHDPESLCRQVRRFFAEEEITGTIPIVLPGEY